MELYYYQTEKGNFGDDLNRWLWDALLPGWRDVHPEKMLVGVGTLINNSTLPRGMAKVVMGSGWGYGAVPDAQLMGECTFYAVRGPRSAAALGLPPERGVIDPAALLPLLPEFQGIRRAGPAIFIPHHESLHRQDWAAICRRAGVDFVSPETEARAMIRRLAAAPLVITESMHGAIIADAFGTPWQGVAIARKFFPAKWADWGDSVGLTLDIPDLDPVSRGIAMRLMGGAPPATGSRETAPKGAAHAPPARKPGPKRWLRGLSRDAMIRIEALRSPGRLRAFARGPGTLSDRARLAAAQDRFKAVLEEAARDLGLTERPVWG